MPFNIHMEHVMFLPASRYDLRYCDNFNDLTDDFTNCDPVKESSMVKGSLHQPRSAMEREAIVFHVTEQQMNKSENYALRVYDQGNLQSDVSNIVRVFVPLLMMHGPTTTGDDGSETTRSMDLATTTTTTPDETTSSRALATTATTTPKEALPSSNPMVKTILIVTSVNTLVIISVLSMLVVMVIWLCNKNKVAPEPLSPSPYPDTLTTSKVALLVDAESLAGEEFSNKRPVSAQTHDIRTETRPPSQTSYVWSWQGAKK